MIAINPDKVLLHARRYALGPGALIMCFVDPSKWQFFFLMVLYGIYLEAIFIAEEVRVKNNPNS